MLTATTDTINAAPPLYFILTWICTFVSRGSVIAPRLLSAVAVATAFLIMFAVLRRAYGVLPSVLALVVLFADPFILILSAEARFHTLFLAEVALAVLIYQRLATHRRPPVRLLIANAACHACMMLTSYMALFYSGAILGAVLVSGLLLKRNPTRACSSIVAGWLVFLPWIPVFLKHLQMTKESWIQVPTAATLRIYFEGYLNPNFWNYVKVLAASACLTTVAAMIYGGRWRHEGPRRREIPLLVLVPGLIAVPLVVYLLSRRAGGTSMFLERYLLASLLGWAILLAHFAHRAFRIRHRRGLRKVTWALSAVQIVITIVLAGASVRTTVITARRASREPMPPEILANIPGDEPVVVEHIHEFMRWHFYSAHPARFVFLVDPEVGRKEAGGALLNHAVMAALKRNFPAEFKGVMPTEEFLRTAASFYVRPYEGFLWTPTRLERNPAFTIERKSQDLLHVERMK